MPQRLLFEYRSYNKKKKYDLQLRERRMTGLTRGSGAAYNVTGKRKLTICNRNGCRRQLFQGVEVSKN